MKPFEMHMQVNWYVATPKSKVFYDLIVVVVSMAFKSFDVEWYPGILCSSINEFIVTNQCQWNAISTVFAKKLTVGTVSCACVCVFTWARIWIEIECYVCLIGMHLIMRQNRYITMYLRIHIQWWLEKKTSKERNMHVCVF